MPSDLSKQILPCRACETLSPRAAASVRPFVKLCASLDIYTHWKPNPVKVLFLAEAPPGNSKGYFYDPIRHEGYRETLRRKLFELLEVTGRDRAAQLVEFKRLGYFLADAIKCRCKKFNGQPPEAVTRMCAGKWLLKELEELGWPRRICVLGKAALLALSQVPGFESLGGRSLSEDCGEVVTAGWARVLIFPFLSGRNKRIYATHLDEFKAFCREAEKLEALLLEYEDTVNFLSEGRKTERERQACAALLRCLGIRFEPEELVPSDTEPPDVLFADARFEVREFLDKERRRHDEWKQKRDRARKAGSFGDLLEPQSSPRSLTYAEIVSLVTTGLAEKASKYGKVKCSSLDALAYVNLRDKYLNLGSPIPDVMELIQQGWRSVSLLMPPYGLVLYATDSAPGFLGTIVGQTKQGGVDWLDGLFEL